MSIEQTIIWRRLNVNGHEYAQISTENEQRKIRGTAIFVFERQFCRLAYTINCDLDWQTVSAAITGFVGDQKIVIEISVDAEKHWIINEKENKQTVGCTDLDLNFSLVTNTLPLKRLSLKVGEKAEVCAAWLRFPEFTLEPLEQIYERTGENKYYYESAGGAFQTEIETNDYGLVTNYPGFGEIEK